MNLRLNGIKVVHFSPAPDKAKPCEVTFSGDFIVDGVEVNLPAPVSASEFNAAVAEANRRAKEAQS